MQTKPRISMKQVSKKRKSTQAKSSKQRKTEGRAPVPSAQANTASEHLRFRKNATNPAMTSCMMKSVPVRLMQPPGHVTHSKAKTSDTRNTLLLNLAIALSSSNHPIPEVGLRLVHKRHHYTVPEVTKQY